MATTQKGIVYPDDYSAAADVPAAMEAMAESIDTAIGNSEPSATNKTPSDYVSDVNQTNKFVTEAEKTKLAGIETGATRTIVDDELSDSSENPVQNKVITAKVNDTNEVLEQVERQFKDTNATGTSIVLTDSSDMRFKEFQIKGNHTQGDNPSTSSPQTINVVGSNGSINATVQNKQLFNKDSEYLSNRGTLTINGTTITYTGSSSSSVSNMCWVIPIEPLKTVLITASSVEKGSNTNNFVRYAFTDTIPSSVPTGSATTSITVALTAGKATVTPTDPTHKYLILQLRAGTTPASNSYITVKDLMVRQYGNDTYKAYNKQTYTMPVQAIMLDGDYLDWSNEKEIHNWSKIDSYAGETITTDYISTTGGLDTGATVYYKLATPTEIAFTAEQKTVAEQIKIAHSYRDVTYINSTNTVSPVFDVIYYKDLQVQIDTIDAKIPVERTDTKVMSIELEPGGLNNYGRINDLTATNFYIKKRMGVYLGLNGKGTGITAESIADCTLTRYDYDENFELLTTNTVDFGTEQEIPAGVYYIKYTIQKETNFVSPYLKLNITIKENANATFVKNIYKDIEYKFNYPVLGQLGRDNSGITPEIQSTYHYTNGLLKLPTSYTEYGEPTQLVIFCHGSQDFKDFGQTEIGAGVNYQKYIQYLADEGYAVFDCFGHTDNAPYDSSDPHTYGSVDCMNCYVDGYAQLIKNYNIRTDGVFVTGKSSGGVSALNLAFQNTIPVLACCPLAPAISQFYRWLGYDTVQRKEFAWAFGFEGDYDVLNSEGSVSPTYNAEPAYTQDLIDFYTANAPKMIGYNPMWNGIIGTPLSTLLEWALAKSGNRLGAGELVASNWTNVYRYCPVPIKIWVANDDTNIPPDIVKNFLTTLKNGNSIAELRLMPDNTGGHHSVDTDANAVQTSVTTALGIYYENITISYPEMVAFFRRYK